jgi:glycosyltransferase involved in cell wall biosynthesis
VVSVSVPLQGARISVGISASDGIATSALEAMVMGSVPIQSDTACASEWFEDGVSGLSVPADDPGAIARAVERALDDDAWVDAAATRNAAIARERLAVDKVRDTALSFYRTAAGGT